VPVHAWLRPLVRHPRFVSLAALAGTMALAGGLHELDYDHNLLNLQPEGLESVAVEKKLLEECDQSVWYALSIADSREELLARKERLQALPSVERVDEIASLVPADEDLKRPIIERIRQRLASLPERPPEIPVDRLDALGETLAWAQGEAAKRPGGLRTAWHLEPTATGPWPCSSSGPPATCSPGSMPWPASPTPRRRGSTTCRRASWSGSSARAAVTCSRSTAAATSGTSPRWSGS
jgi:hypothetical protein